jgi:hypothetical protein
MRMRASRGWTRRRRAARRRAVTVEQLERLIDNQPILHSREVLEFIACGLVDAESRTGYSGAQTAGWRQADTTATPSG